MTDEECVVFKNKQDVFDYIINEITIDELNKLCNQKIHKNFVEQIQQHYQNTTFENNIKKIVCRNDFKIKRETFKSFEGDDDYEWNSLKFEIGNDTFEFFHRIDRDDDGCCDQLVFIFILNNKTFKKINKKLISEL